jgi:hypothetical protein
MQYDKDHAESQERQEHGHGRGEKAEKAEKQFFYKGLLVPGGSSADSKNPEQYDTKPQSRSISTRHSLGHSGVEEGDGCGENFFNALHDPDFIKATPQNSTLREHVGPDVHTNPNVVRVFTQAATLTQLKSMESLFYIKKGDAVWFESDDYPNKIKAERKEDHAVWTPVKNPRPGAPNREHWLVFTVKQVQCHKVTVLADASGPIARSVHGLERLEATPHKEIRRLVLTMEHTLSLNLGFWLCVRLWFLGWKRKKKSTGFETGRSFCGIKCRPFAKCCPSKKTDLMHAVDGFLRHRCSNIDAKILPREALTEADEAAGIHAGMKGHCIRTAIRIHLRESPLLDEFVARLEYFTFHTRRRWTSSKMKNWCLTTLCRRTLKDRFTEPERFFCLEYLIAHYRSAIDHASIMEDEVRQHDTIEDHNGSYCIMLVPPSP